MNEVLRFLGYAWMFYLRHVLDIIICAYIIYKIMTLLSGTRSVQVLRGIVLLIFATVIANVLDFILIWSYPPELDGEINSLDHSRLKNRYKEVFVEFINTLRRPNIFSSLVNVSVFSGYHKAVKDYLQEILKTLALSLPVFLMFQDKQRSSLIIGVTFFILYILTSIASRNSGKIASRFKDLAFPLNLLMIIGFSMGILCGLFYALEWYFWAVLFFIIIYLLLNIRKPMGVAYISDKVDRKIMASTFSTSSQLQTITAAILAPIIGLLADSLGVGYALAITSALLIVSTPFYLAGRNNVKE